MSIDNKGVRSSPAEMAPEDLRRLGYAAIDAAVRLLDNQRQHRTSPDSSPAMIRAALGSANLPEEGSDPASLLDFTSDFLASHSTFNGHPRFWGYITGSAAPVCVIADILATAINANAGAWALSPAATEVEKQTISWICNFLTLSDEWGGLFVSGGNMANITAFAAACAAKEHRKYEDNSVRSSREHFTVYASEETHTWIQKAARLTGIGRDAVRLVGTDAQLRLRPDLLRACIKQDRADGSVPFMIIGTAGTVSTGAVDPLVEIADIASEEDLWFHVDGAYGAPAVALESAPRELYGIRDADSIAIDPHKWMYASLEAGCILFRQPDLLRNAFSFAPPYYRFAGHEGEPPTNYHEWGLQNSRGFRALKVWMMFKHFGASGFREMIADDITLAEMLFTLIDREPQLQAFTRSLSIVTFRYVPESISDSASEHLEYLNELNQLVLDDIVRQGRVFLSNAVIHGVFVLRACIVNFRTQPEDLAILIDVVSNAGRERDLVLRANHV